MNQEDNSHWYWALGIVGIAAAAGVAYYFAWHVPNSQPPVQATAPVEAPVEIAPPAPAAIQHPIEDAPAQPAPAAPPAKPVTLDDSDAALRDALAEAPSTKRLIDVLNPGGAIIRRIVATVDNLPRSKVATQVLPVRTLGSALAAAGAGDDLAIAPANTARYSAYVSLLEALDMKKVASIYTRHYALFQEAYRDLGYPKGYFNDRLVETIDHLLATPAVQGPIRLRQPKVLHEFADPDLEAMSAGRKVLVRMGTDNAGRVKAKLRELRAEVTRRPPQG
jgi:hypothetical protein